MNRSFYFKLALTNIKKNGKFYFPYLLTCIGTVMMFYIMCFLSTNEGISTMRSGGQYLQTIMFFGTIVIGLFAGIFLFYTNSFLIKRRKKEFGLFNILGMDKRNLARVIGIENIIIAFIGLVGGFLCGILFSRLMVMLLIKILQFQIQFNYNISSFSIITTLLVFSGFFILIYLNTLRQIHFAHPIELLYGSNVGEREPKAKWVLALLGLIFLAAGYAIAILTESPLSAIGLFFVAVIFVIIGTYLLFIAGSIALLKILKKNKNYFYTTKHFISVSSMMYRMKQNAVGLANICILSTMVLVMISTTISLYLGYEDTLRNMFPRNIEIAMYGVSSSDTKLLTEKIEDIISDSSVNVIDPIHYEYVNYTVTQEGNVLSFFGNGIGTEGILAYFITVDEYNRSQNTSASLNNNELLMYGAENTINNKEIYFNHIKYNIKEQLSDLDISQYSELNYTSSYYVFIMPTSSSIEDIYRSMHNANDGLSYYYGFDINGSGDNIIASYNKIDNSIKTLNGIEYESSYVRCVESVRNEFLSIYGGLFFLGIFLGLLFLMATVLIIYYKQISEGYDDKARFEIMQKVGMSRSEVKSSVNTQVLTVFFLPLIVAVIHILAAFKMITKLLALFGLTNISLFALCTLTTLLVFSMIYTAVYLLTAKVYYRIVK
jgi:putative ABC transport system permease protein